MSQPESSDKAGQAIDAAANIRRAWYDQARIELSTMEGYPPDRRPILREMAFDQLMGLMRAYIQCYEAAYFSDVRSAGGTNLPDAGPSPRADAFYAVRDGRIHRPGITAEQGYEFARGLDRMLLQLEKAAFARSAIPTSSEDKSPSSANTATVKEVRNEMAEFYASDALNTDERTVGNQLDCKVAEKLSRWIGMLR